MCNDALRAAAAAIFGAAPSPAEAASVRSGVVAFLTAMAAAGPSELLTECLLEIVDDITGAARDD